jgi:WD40 repeat protein
MMPQLCTIKELKANNDACWNHRGDKFVVGSASGNVFVAAYNPSVGLWVAPAQTDDKPLHDMPVVCVRFDPGSSRVVASASADG